jgi:hypothetical protein
MRSAKAGRMCCQLRCYLGFHYLVFESLDFCMSVIDRWCHLTLRLSKGKGQRPIASSVVIPGTHGVHGYPTSDERHGLRRGQSVKAAQHPKGLAFTDWHCRSTLFDWKGWGCGGKRLAPTCRSCTGAYVTVDDIFYQSRWPSTIGFNDDVGLGIF